MSTHEARYAADIKAIEAISATDAILFSLKIEDHHDRLQWLQDWIVGAWGDMHRSYPAFAKGAWRSRSHSEVY